MEKIKNTLATLVLGGALAIFGCDTTTTTQQKNVVCQTIEDGKNVRIMAVTSDKHYWNNKQEEIREELEKVINGDEYNIISVKTAYSDAYLTSAEVRYNIAEDCDNKRLRVIFVHSDKYYWSQKQEEVKPRLETLVNNGNHNIQDINSIMLKGYLVAAEVYYRATPDSLPN